MNDTFQTLKTMKLKVFILSLFFFLYGSLSCFSQHREGFDIIKLIESSPIKNQQSSGTCWSFATTSFIETEAIRMGKKSVILSPIFYVAPTYIAKAEKYVRQFGHGYFLEGDLTFSVLDAYKTFGAIPEEIYNGILENEYRHDHVEMDVLLSAMVKTIANENYGRIKQDCWKKAFEGTLKAYLGEAPNIFEYEGESYTPKTFADKFIGINTDDYIEITSFNHKPFHTKFVLEIPANWNNNFYLNLPIDEFKKVIDNAIKNGYSLCWDGDNSERGCNEEKGLAELSGRFRKERIITQEMRQFSFDDYSTRDNHNMHLIGIAKNMEGKMYYILKNSNGTGNEGKGYLYMAENYLLLKTISVMVHKDAIPDEIRTKCNHLL